MIMVTPSSGRRTVGDVAGDRKVGARSSTERQAVAAATRDETGGETNNPAPRHTKLTHAGSASRPRASRSGGSESSLTVTRAATSFRRAYARRCRMRCDCGGPLSPEPRRTVCVWRANARQTDVADGFAMRWGRVDRRDDCSRAGKTFVRRAARTARRRGFVRHGDRLRMCTQPGEMAAAGRMVRRRRKMTM